MRTFRNLNGTIMHKNCPLIAFIIEKGKVVKLQKLSEKLPYEFQCKVDDEEALLYFLDDRVIPETRIGIQKELQSVGIPYFDPDRILKYNNGSAATDDYWVKFEDGVQKFEDLKIKQR